MQQKDNFQLISGMHDAYSNSFISPNSAREEPPRYQPISADVTSGPGEIRTSENEIPVGTKKVAHSTHVITRRDADPIMLKTTNIDDLVVMKNVEDQLDSNDVELSGRADHFIRPSKTIKEDSLDRPKQTDFVHSGEANRAPQGRSVALSEPVEINPTATMLTQNFATLSHLYDRARQVDPDIKGIISGIVNLLHGKVNVQANTAPAHVRPMRPLSSRINNRGPPRITDVPALPPDFDIPGPPLPPPPLGQMSPPIAQTKIPTPYPFDIPPHNTSPVRPYPMHDKVIPVGSNKRPGFYRPVTIPPWNRPPHRRPNPNRRPQPAPYKPHDSPKIPEDTISLTSEKPLEDILTLDFGTELESSMEDDNTKKDEVEEPTSQKSISEAEIKLGEVPTSPGISEENSDNYFEINKEKTSPKTDKHTKNKLPLIIENMTPTSVVNGANSIEPTSVSAITSVSTVLQTINNSTNIELVNDPDSVSEDILGDITHVLEPSIQSVMETLKEELLNTTSIAATPSLVLPQLIPSAVQDSELTTSQITHSAPTHTEGN